MAFSFGYVPPDADDDDNNNNNSNVTSSVNQAVPQINSPATTPVSNTTISPVTTPKARTFKFIPSVAEGEESTDEDAALAAERYTDLATLITKDPEFYIMEACNVVAPTNQSQNIIKPLISVYISECIAYKAIMYRIAKVVDETTDKATLFRSKTFSTVLLSVFAQQIGHSYMKQVVRPLIHNICSKEQSFELDPNKLKEGDDTEENLKLLISCLEECFKFIENNIHRCPKSLWYACKLLYEEVHKKFESTSLSAVGGLFFLRFLCPAIVNPQGVGLSIPGIGAKQRRHLVLVSKTLQSLSNGVEFGGKEMYMTGLNPFIREYQPRIAKLLERLARGPDEEVTLVEQSIVEADCYNIHKWLVEYREKMEAELDKLNPETNSNFKRIMDKLGEPREQSNIKKAKAIAKAKAKAKAKKRGSTVSAAWKTSELPPELAAALLEVGNGTLKPDLAPLPPEQDDNITNTNSCPNSPSSTKPPPIKVIGVGAKAASTSNLMHSPKGKDKKMKKRGSGMNFFRRNKGDKKKT